MKEKGKRILGLENCMCESTTRECGIFKAHSSISVTTNTELY